MKSSDLNIAYIKYVGLLICKMNVDIKALALTGGSVYQICTKRSLILLYGRNNFLSALYVGPTNTLKSTG